MSDRDRKSRARNDDGQGGRRAGADADSTRLDARWDVPGTDGPHAEPRETRGARDGRGARDVPDARDGGGAAQIGDRSATRSHRRALEDAAADTREPERAAELRAEDNERTAERQEQLSMRERHESLRLDENARGLDSSAEALASTRERVRNLGRAASDLARDVDSLRKRTQRVAKNVRRTEVRGDEG